MRQLPTPQNTELRRAFTVWIHRVVLRRFSPDDKLPELQDLSEVTHMIRDIEFTKLPFKLASF